MRELNDDGYASVVRYGMAFFGKDCVVRMEEGGCLDITHSPKELIIL